MHPRRSPAIGRRRGHPGRLAGLLLAGLTVVSLVSSTAYASHYLIGDVPLIRDESRVAFERFGLRTTEDVLRHVVDHEERAAIRFATGVAEEELVTIARVCDLLQIEGVGPKVVRVLLEIGVEGSADLAERDVDELLAEIEALQQMEPILGVMPNAENVSAWIERAGSVPVSVSYADSP